jgi:N-acetyl-anhydromuramyl-L-alanine amidase AmpD
MAKGLRFTKAQHDTLIDLAKEISVRHGWPAGWHRTPRLLGHEDVDILNRMDKGGGWDPGSLRSAPYFDFSYVRSHIA